MKWKYIQEKEWPFRAWIKDEKSDSRIAEVIMNCVSTKDRTIEEHSKREGNKLSFTNARLISAAPEMLEFLIEAYKSFAKTENLWELASFFRPIIEKATGQKIEDILK